MGEFVLKMFWKVGGVLTGINLPFIHSFIHSFIFFFFFILISRISKHLSYSSASSRNGSHPIL